MRPKAFYKDLFGWGTLDLPIGPDMYYTMFQNQGEHAAGFAAMMPDMQAQGIPLSLDQLCLSR